MTVSRHASDSYVTFRERAGRRPIRHPDPSRGVQAFRRDPHPKAGQTTSSPAQAELCPNEKWSQDSLSDRSEYPLR